MEFILREDMERIGKRCKYKLDLEGVRKYLPQVIHDIIMKDLPLNIDECDFVGHVQYGWRGRIGNNECRWPECVLTLTLKGRPGCNDRLPSYVKFLEDNDMHFPQIPWTPNLSGCDNPEIIVVPVYHPDDPKSGWMSKGEESFKITFGYFPVNEPITPNTNFDKLRAEIIDNIMGYAVNYNHKVLKEYYRVKDFK